ITIVRQMQFFWPNCTTLNVAGRIFVNNSTFNRNAQNFSEHQSGVVEYGWTALKLGCPVEAILFGNVPHVGFLQTRPRPQQRKDALLVVNFRILFHVGVCVQTSAINFQCFVESHLTAPALNRFLMLRLLTKFLFPIAQAKFGNRKHVRFEALANKFAANTNAAEIHSAWNVTDQICVRSFLPEPIFLGGFLFESLLHFHAFSIQYQYPICKK
ncbi:MAG: hypothetical protein WBW41_16655, partial [Verrucomicrobiia bacterium]